MANTLITPLAVAKLALPTLLNNLCFAALVHRDYSSEFRKVGEKVRVRKPAVFTAVEFDGDLEGQWQAITESYIDVLMDTVLTVPIEFSQVEQSLSIVNFQMQVLEPAMQALAQKVDEKIALLYKDIPYYSDTTGTTVVADLLNARKLQNDLKVPFDQTRYAVMSPLTAAALLGLAAFHEVDKVGETKPLREASLGRKFGYEFYENQNIQNHYVGDGTAQADLAWFSDNPGNTYPIGTTTIHCDAMANATYKKGTIITITGQPNTYVITADVLPSGNEADIPIYPALTATLANDVAVTGHAYASTARENLMFHKNCFGMVSAPMAPPAGGATGATVTYKNLAINVVYSYKHEKFQNRMTASILCGFKTLTPELGLRLYDAS